MTNSMCEKIILEKLSWLGDLLTGKRLMIDRLFLRLRAFGESVGNSLGWHTKVAHLWEQIACEREKELDLIFEIETIEKRHREMKQLKLLKQADARLAEKKIAEPEFASAQEDDEDEEESFGLLKLLGLLYFFAPNFGWRKNPQPKIQ